MSPTGRPRRSILAAGASLVAAGVAGCAGSNEVTSTSSGGRSSNEIPASSTAYDHLAVRADTTVPLIYPQDDPPETDTDRLNDPHQTQFLVSATDVETLQLDIADPSTVRSFLTTTDFDAASIAIDQRPVKDCYQRHLLSVRADPDEFRTWYCRSLKPPTARCDADHEVLEITIIRVQRAYDEAPSSRSRSERGTCPTDTDQTTETHTVEVDR